MFESRSAEVLVAVVGDAHRQESMQMARKLDAVAELLGHRVDEEMARDVDISSMITGFARTTAEVSAAMNMTPGAAREFVRAAEALQIRLPAVGALLASGHVDWRTVEIIVSRTDLVDEDKVAPLDARLAEQIAHWYCFSRQRIINAVDSAVKTVDAEAAKQRRVVAFDERGITVTAGPDGMARLRGSLPATAGAAFDKRLSQLAASVCKDDPRTLKQRRADAAEAALEGLALACACGNPDCPTRAEQTPAPTPPRTVLNVIASADTVAGRSEQPGYLAGFGVIDAELVRALARDSVRRILAQPEISDDAALRYRPSTALDRWVRLRDLTCRFPGCTVAAERCDVDHTEPFNHADPGTGGQTVPWNLACYCREHHRLKTFHGGLHGWRDEQLPDGTIVWTSPTGQLYRTTPGGSDVFPQLRQTRPRSDAEQARIAAARERLRQRRPVNEYHRHRNRQAAEDIRLRKWRNQARKLRTLFHGYPPSIKPSTSPFMTWVNDPFEPEHLPPDWQPPPLTSSDPDEPPPF